MRNILKYQKPFVFNFIQKKRSVTVPSVNNSSGVHLQVAAFKIHLWRPLSGATEGSSQSREYTEKSKSFCFLLFSL